MQSHKFRVTVTLGRSHLDRDQLLDEARKLDLASRTADVAVDPVKAAIDITLTIESPDALTAATLGLAQIVTAFERADLDRPATVVSVEAEAVPKAAEDDPFLAAVD